MSSCQCAKLIKAAGGRHGSKVAGGSQREKGAPPNAARQQRAAEYRARGAGSQWSEEEWREWRKQQWSEDEWGQWLEQRNPWKQ